MHQLHHLSRHVYWLTPEERTDRPILAAVAGTKGTCVIDAGNSPAHVKIFLKELENANVAPPRFAALTHWHWDHVFGASALDVPLFAYTETKRIVESMASLEWSDGALERRVQEGLEIAFCRDHLRKEFPDPDRADLVIRPPDIAFAHQIEIDLGDVLCLVLHVGGDHATDSSIVYIPDDHVAFIGDCIYPDLYHQPEMLTTQRVFMLIDRLLGLDAEFYLDAHVPAPIPREQFINEMVKLRTIGRTVEQLGDNKAAIVTKLQQTFQRPLTQDQLESLDAFLTGLRA